MDPQPHWIGERFGGGIVFDVSADGQHGLIAETIDQGYSNWHDAFTLVNTGTHSEAGKAFTDWRLPTKEELCELFYQKETVGGFGECAEYWSSTEYNIRNAWIQGFYSGG